MANIWGVDSAAIVTKELYDCVLNNYGKPDYWGRYLKTVGPSEGLTKEEIQLLHSSDTRVLPIYNDFTKAIGYRPGKVVAQNAIFNARRLGFPKNKMLFASIEKLFDVDEAWIRGYVDAMYTSDYKPGLYADPVNGDFSKAYCEAVKKNESVAVQTVVWSAEPEVGVSKERNKPPFKPATPSCDTNVWGWQYGRNASSCPIDTNLINNKLYDMLW